MIQIYKYGEVENDKIFARAVAEVDVAAIVTDIIDSVRKNGDAALLEYCERFDKVKLDSLEVSAEEIDEAFASVGEEFIRVMRDAAANIYAFHKRQVRNSFVIEETDGVVMGQRVTPIDRVGLYQTTVRSFRSFVWTYFTKLCWVQISCFKVRLTSC